MDENIANFVGITSAPEEAARHVLEMCAGDLMQAIQLWFNDEELQRSLTNPGSAAAQSAAPPVPHSSRPPRNIGHQDESGVIHIDSDDDDDVEMLDDDLHGASRVAQTAQEEEDAAMARRLQEEAYGSGGPAEEDGVRAPIGRVTETLVAPSAGPWEPDDDDHAQMLEQFRQRQRNAGMARRGGRGNPFAQSIWDGPPPAHPDAAEPGAPRAGPSGPSSRALRLAELFRPPYDIMSDELTWDDAREEGKADLKWILVNLQDMTDFNCQALNRDIWKDQAIKSLVKENFVFLQYSKDDPRAQEFIQFYFPNRSHENPNNYPHVSIVDPRTGEQVKTWSGVPFPSALDFHAQLAEFLDRYSLDPTAKNPVVKAKRPERVVDVDRMTEDEMLEMALKNSMESNGDTATPDVHDPDELTRSIAGLDKGKEAEIAEPEPQEASAFAKIASDKPHTEPANDPATTTRIQLRHPTGRIIRRFNIEDPVSRIYEWLKAEPLEGKEGLEFELKTIPQGKDLIEELDTTILDAALKQATIMIEFI